MPEYLVGLMFHEPESFALWNKSLIEDYESSTGLFVQADSAAEAIAWGEEVGEALLRYVNHDETLNWSAFGYYSWLEESPQKSDWGHCLRFFQHVQVGELPDLAMMTTAAYSRWLEQAQVDPNAARAQPRDAGLGTS